MVVFHRPPAEGDEGGEQPVEQPDPKIPNRLLHPGNRQCSGARNGLWQASHALSTSSCRAMTLLMSPVFAATSIACAATAKSLDLRRNTACCFQISGFGRVL